MEQQRKDEFFAKQEEAEIRR